MWISWALLFFVGVAVMSKFHFNLNCSSSACSPAVGVFGQAGTWGQALEQKGDVLTNKQLFKLYGLC